MGITDYISYLIGADDVKEAKPKPEPVLKTLAAMHYTANETLVVGDMAVDILMGANAGAKTCGVTWGNGTREEFKEAGADFIIDFYATWCGPCQALAPMLKRLADEYEGRIKVLKVDVDKNQALAAAARIQSIPTLFFITKNGDIERVVGGLPYQELVRMAEKIS